MTRINKNRWERVLVYTSIMCYVIAGVMYFFLHTAFTIPFILMMVGLFLLVASTGFNEYMEIRYIWEKDDEI